MRPQLIVNSKMPTCLFVPSALWRLVTSKGTLDKDFIHESSFPRVPKGDWLLPSQWSKPIWVLLELHCLSSKGVGGCFSLFLFFNAMERGSPWPQWAMLCWVFQSGTRPVALHAWLTQHRSSNKDFQRIRCTLNQLMCHHPQLHPPERNGETNQWWTSTNATSINAGKLFT